MDGEAQKNKIMTFFLKNKTTCKICNLLIEEHKNAVVLDYLSPEKYPEFIPYVRSFVHRSCLTKWNLRDAYVHAAFELVTDAFGENKITQAIYADDFVLITNLEELIILRDYYVLLEIRIDISDLKNFIVELKELINDFREQLIYDDWSISELSNELVYVKCKNGEEIGEVMIPRERIFAWISATSGLVL